MQEENSECQTTGKPPLKYLTCSMELGICLPAYAILVLAKVYPPLSACHCPEQDRPRIDVHRKNNVTNHPCKNLQLRGFLLSED